MAITHSQAAKQAATNAIVDLVDAGSGAGKIICKTSGDSVLATFTLDAVAAFGAADANGTATLDVSPAISTTASAPGTATKFDITDSDDNVILSGTVGTSGADLNFDNNVWTAGQTLTISSLTYDSGEA